MRTTSRQQQQQQQQQQLQQLAVLASCWRGHRDGRFGRAACCVRLQRVGCVGRVVQRSPMLTSAAVALVNQVSKCRMPSALVFMPNVDHVKLWLVGRAVRRPLASDNSSDSCQCAREACRSG
jgi:hypothetical protein